MRPRREELRSPRVAAALLVVGLACAGPAGRPLGRGAATSGSSDGEAEPPAPSAGASSARATAPEAESARDSPPRGLGEDTPAPTAEHPVRASLEGTPDDVPREPWATDAAPAVAGAAGELLASAAPAAFGAALRPDLGGGMVLAGRSTHRMVLFTFDDGPHPVHTRRVLAHLSRAGIRGVFFVNAHRFDASSGWYAECATVLREVAAAGHVIGSHGRDHALTAGLSGPALDAQIVGAEDIFVRVLGARPWLFRPPGGVRSEATDAYLAARGYTQVLWTLHTGDYETREPDVVLANFRSSIAAREHTETPGGIAVIHDTHPWGVEALPRMIRYLRRRNCELLEEDEELYDIVDDPRLFFVPRTDGAGASELAPPVRLPPEVAAARQARLRERERERCGMAD